MRIGLEYVTLEKNEITKSLSTATENRKGSRRTQTKSTVSREQ